VVAAAALDAEAAAVVAERSAILGLSGKVFIDLQNDVTAADVRLAHREGYVSVEHLKRYTTLGMGTDQGKTSNLPALELMAELTGASPEKVGTTTFRPPYTPVAIGALAGRSVGRHFRPTRRTPMHGWHLAHGAEMVEVGLWMRPWFYRGNGADVDEAYVREMRAVRETAGLVDISTLGKIEVQGADALAFLDRVYANSLASLPIGRARYGVMLRDDGIVFDDGTVTRLGERRFFVTTSTAKAADVMSWLEFLLDAAWRDLDVHVTSVSDDWAAMSLAGPASRRILAEGFPALDLTDAALPHLGLLEGADRGFPLRILRLSYSGELAFEIYAAAPHGLAVWERLVGIGAAHGLRPYGVEALGALRIEKGHAAGPEIDGRTTLRDLGLERLASRKKTHVGAVLAERPAFSEPQRRRLVGLECLDPGGRLRSGAVLFDRGDAIAGHGRGRITSTTWSPALGRSIGLGFWQGDRSEEGREIVAVHTLKNETVRARIVSPIFLDPAGERLRG
jgi:sarcosine oxidase subunit alpha